MSKGFVPGVNAKIALFAAHAVAASTALVILGSNTTGNSFSYPINANAQMLAHLYMPFSVGATGGLKVQGVVPAAPTAAETGVLLEDCVTTATIPSFTANNNAFANALAVAGSHYLHMWFWVQNGANPGTVSIQVACNSAANAFTALLGTYLEITIL